MKLKPNREFLLRHLFVALLMFGMACWFGYDGYVKYPSMTPGELYEYIEKSPAPDAAAAQRVYANAIPRQKQFMCLAFLASFIIAAHLWYSTKLKFSFDDSGFEFSLKRYSYNDIKSVDDSQWKKNTITRLMLADGKRVKLDAWHLAGVKEFHERIPEKYRQQ